MYKAKLDGVGTCVKYLSRSFNFQLSNSWRLFSFSCFATYIDCVIVSHPQTGSLEKASEEKEVQFKCQCDSDKSIVKAWSSLWFPSKYL